MSETLKEESKKKITRGDMELWAENYREAIDTLMWFIESDYTKEDLIESIQEFVEESYGGK